jgi:maltose alpha-D-glucosyltransferase/alpha-amylase
VRKLDEDTILCIANLARTVQPVELDLSRYRGMIPVEMLGLTEFPRIGELPYFLTLGPYAFYWFRLQHAAPAITARMAPETATDVPVAPGLLIGAAWETLLDGSVRALIERDLLLPFLQRQRWYGGKARTARSARFLDWGLLRRGPQPLFLTIVEVTYEDGERDQYFVPLTVCAASDVRGLEERSPHTILARVTGARKGVLFDGWMDDRFARTLLDAIDRQEHTSTRAGSVRAEHTPAFAAERDGLDPDWRVGRTSAEQSNTSILFGDRLILKLFRRLQPGMNPDYEIGRYLTETVNFDRVPSVAGALHYERSGEPPTTIGMIQKLVESQADGWEHATDDLSRFYDQVAGREPPRLPPPASFSDLAEAEAPKPVQDVMSGYLRVAETLGRRTADLHLALAKDASNPAFAPEPFTKEDLRMVSADAAVQAIRALRTLEARVVSPAGVAGGFPDDVAHGAAELIASGQRLLDSVRSGPELEFAIVKTRIHGDYHLGQVLWAEGDFYILDFEGEPARPVEQRRQKQSPLKDVAGMIRSFSYAAYAGLFAHTSARPGDFTRLEPWARIWQTWATAAFLGGYLQKAEGALFLPAERSLRDALLRFFMLDKALYELNYELNNRPEWVRIPLWGIFELLEG